MPAGIRRRPRCAAFTLIELMIVVAIIAMLAAIAVPQYQSYVARTQFAEALSLFAGVRTAVEAEAQLRGSGALDNAVLDGQRTEGDYVDDITLDTSSNGAAEVTVTFADSGVNEALAGEEVTFTGSGWADGVEWSCEPDADIEELATGICATSRGTED
ncbi:MAG: pilin [Halorhodospira sp.]